MICYRDKTFCNAKCGTTQCPTKLTGQVKRQAAAWWGSDDAPISVSDFSKDCKAYRQKGDL